MTYRPTDRFENWFVTSLQTAVNDTTSSFRLNDNLNIQKCRLVIDPHDESVREVVKVTSVDGNLVYVERGDDNTPASYHLEGAVVALNVVAADMNDLYEDFEGVVDATDAANQAASDAAQAAIDANQATTDANNAAGAATTATGNANSATSAANSAAGSANSAASSANTAAGNAQTAADNAQGIVDDVAGAVDDGILPIQINGAKTAVGIGKAPTDGALDVDGDIYSNGEKVALEDMLPTSGSNSNGYWVRFPGGMQICYSPYISVGADDIGGGAFWRSSSNTETNWTYPAPFNRYPVITGSPNSTGWAGTSGIARNIYTTSATVSLMSAYSRGNHSSVFMAIGTWK